MPGCHDSGANTRTGKPFLVTAYEPDENGKLAGLVPDRCIAAEPGQQCRLRVDHYRQRKTGPCFAVAVVRCAAHNHAFTLYPPGHYPYGRIAAAPVAPDGSLLRQADESLGKQTSESPSAPSRTTEAAKTQLPVDWSQTLFGAAQDAERGQAWPRRGPALWRTQGRWVRLGARLLGIESPADDDERQRHCEQMAGLLGVPTQRLLDASQRYQDSAGYRGRGAAVMGIVWQLPLLRTLSERILAAGAIAGLWGRPSRWDPGGGQLRALLFR